MKIESNLLLGFWLIDKLNSILFRFYMIIVNCVEMEGELFLWYFVLGVLIV